MFERFTERARKVVVLAQEEAARPRHGYVGAEHLLLGLIREEEGVAAQSLRACGVALGEARGRVEAIVGYGEEVDASQILFTQRSKRVLELALREAQSLRHDHIADLMRTGLREADSPILEAVITALGERLLGSFPAMLEVSVSISGQPEPGELPAPTFSVSATLRR